MQVNWLIRNRLEKIDSDNPSQLGRCFRWDWIYDTAKLVEDDLVDHCFGRAMLVLVAANYRAIRRLLFVDGVAEDPWLVYLRSQYAGPKKLVIGHMWPK